MQNYFHIALRGTVALEKCRDYEHSTLQAMILKILGTETPADYQFMQDHLSNDSHIKRVKNLRVILLEEAKALTRDQRTALVEVADRRGNVFEGSQIVDKLGLMQGYNITRE